MYKNVFLRAGLTPTQSEILDFLYEKKESKASDIAKGIKKSRAIVYKDLDELVNFKIVERIDGANQVSIFRIEHPSNIEKFFESRENKLKKDKELFNNYLPDLISSYNLMSNKPGVRFYEGIEGLKKIYDEIIAEQKDFYLVRSAYEPVYEKEILPIVENFIKKRIEKNIKVTAITPTDVKQLNSENDAKWLMNRFWVDKDMYDSPVEIDIFGNKIAILSFGNELMGIIIESKQIAQSLKQIFILATLGAKIKSIENDSTDNNIPTQN